MTDRPDVIDAVAVPVEADAGASPGAGAGAIDSVQPLRVAAKVGGIVAANTAAGESLSALRNFLIAQHLQMGRRSVAICAPHAGSGCTYLSTNLALAMAQAGINTLLIDGNLREPGVADVLTPDRAVPGLSDYLASDEDDSPFLVPDARPNLSIIYAGSAAGASSELLAKQKLKLLINESVRSFDFTIVDCPPAAHFGDARRLASLVRYALVVVRRDHSLAADIKTLVKELQSDGVNVVGTFLNILD
jgi:protein-tyrosine kinase